MNLILVEQRFNKLPVRERLLLTIAAIALLLFIAMHQLFQPMRLQQRVEQQQQADLLIQREQLMAEMASLQARVAQQTHSPDMSRLQQALSDTEAAISTQTQNMVPPQEMGNVLRSVLQQQKGVELLSLQHEHALNDDKTAGTVRYYRHPMQLAIRGNYFDVVRYLQALETLRWRLQWEKLDYAVQSYPIATVSIEVATLSDQKEWLK